MTVDTVEVAQADPRRRQPYNELGLKQDEYRRIRTILGRRPTAAELTMYSVMWSEHCSYKSSKMHLRQIAEKAPPSDALLVGMGENAGVVDVGDGWAVTFKIESHNHPSYVEPYQGAATGVGGIVRDILTMGARPVAVMDSLRFGPATARDTGRMLPGVVAGIGGYGNCTGVPTVGGGSFRPIMSVTSWSMRCASVSSPGMGSSSPGLPVSAMGDLFRARRDRMASERVCTRQRHLRRRRRQAAECSGWRPVRREGPHRVLPGDLCR